MLFDDENPWKLVVKPTDVPKILQENHERPQAGHLGRECTYQRIRQNYYWPGMSQDVNAFVEDCETCLKVKFNQNPLKGLLTTRPLLNPWAQLSVDTVGPLTRSKKGNSYIIVIQDLYTKYVELFPVRNQTGKVVVKALEAVFDRWGTIPESIITDNGTEYINKDVEALFTAKKIKHLTTPLAHPQANPVERVNRTIKPMIAACLKNSQNEWDEFLSKLQLAYNTVPHSSSRITPFYLNHAREAQVIPRNQVIDNPQIITAELVTEWVEKMKKFDEFRHKIEQQMKSNAEKRLAKANSCRTQTVKLKEGMEVYYPNKKLSNKSEGYTAKLGHRFVGPAVIKRIIGRMVVELEDKNKKSVGKYYVTDLKIPRRSLRNL